MYYFNFQSILTRFPIQYWLLPYRTVLLWFTLSNTSTSMFHGLAAARNGWILALLFHFRKSLSIVPLTHLDKNSLMHRWKICFILNYNIIRSIFVLYACHLKYMGSPMKEIKKREKIKNKSISCNSCITKAAPTTMWTGENMNVCFYAIGSNANPYLCMLY